MTAKELYEKYQSDLSELQKHCTHESKSEWMEEEWAPGHSTLYLVKVCDVCDKIVDRELKPYEMPTITTYGSQE